MSLETGAIKDWWGPQASMRQSRKVSMATLWVQTSPAAATDQYCLMEGLSQHSIYHGQTSNKGGKGRAVNLLVKQWRKPAMMTKPKEVPNEADL